MLLFLFSLMSSGLMYYYFQKARFQEQELQRWRAGIKVRDEKPAFQTSSQGPIKKMMSVVKDKIAGMPAPSLAERILGEQVEEKPAAPAPASTPEPTPVVTDTEAAPRPEQEKPAPVPHALDAGMEMAQAAPPARRTASAVIETEEPQPEAVPSAPAAKPSVRESDEPRRQKETSVQKEAPRKVESVYDLIESESPRRRATPAPSPTQTFRSACPSRSADPIGNFLCSDNARQ